MLTTERFPQHWILTLDRPEKANALSAELVERLIDSFDEAQASGVPVVAFRGNGRNFSAGFDFDGFESQDEAHLLHRFVRIETLLQAVYRAPCLTVALAHGRNFGAGADLFAACRWRVASPDASFRMPGLAFGLVLGTRRLAATVGRDCAREMLESLQTVDAPRAATIGLLRRIAPIDDWPRVLDEAIGAAQALDARSRALLYQTLDDADHDADLAALVRSAAAPGLKERMRRYRQSQTSAGRAAGAVKSGVFDATFPSAASAK
ncbi:MAG TPA: enoyl-CoA hydratase/isomerase family protein [Burkholderiaceae bacterium]|nr:enoyl-CoA hydratase/isomerase family protein [Burkholderiaceae bacterium]